MKVSGSGTLIVRIREILLCVPCVSVSVGTSQSIEGSVDHQNVDIMWIWDDTEYTFLRIEISRGTIRVKNDLPFHRIETASAKQGTFDRQVVLMEK